MEALILLRPPRLPAVLQVLESEARLSGCTGAAKSLDFRLITRVGIFPLFGTVEPFTLSWKDPSYVFSLHSSPAISPHLPPATPSLPP